MDAQALIRKLQQQRERQVEVEPGKHVTMRGPTETQFTQFLQGGKLVAGFEQARDFVVGWKAITEADLLGTAVGASDEVEFSPQLWAEVIANHADWVRKITTALLDYIVEYHQRAETIEKN